jgi:hypothetical protein
VFIVTVAKQEILHIISVCLGLVIQRTKYFLRHIVGCDLSVSIMPFAHYLTNSTVWGGGDIERKICVLIFFTVFI